MNAKQGFDTGWIQLRVDGNEMMLEHVEGFFAGSPLRRTSDGTSDGIILIINKFNQ